MVQKYFGVKELVCPHVWERFGESAWVFIDRRLLAVLLWIREELGLPIVVNNWAKGGQYSQRGLRCNCCALVKEKTALEKVYLSQHIQGKAVDFGVVGMKSAEVQRWLDENKERLPYPIRCERDTNGWTHIDVRVDAEDSGKKITWFKG